MMRWKPSATRSSATDQSTRAKLPSNCRSMGCSRRSSSPSVSPSAEPDRADEAILREDELLVDADGGIAEHDLLRIIGRGEEVAGGKYVDARDLEIGGEHAAGIARALAREPTRQELRLLVGGLHQ